MIIQKASYNGKATGAPTDVITASFYADGINNPTIVVEGRIAGKKSTCLQLKGPKPTGGRAAQVDGILGGFGIHLRDQFKKYGVFINGQFYPVANLQDLLVVKQVMGI
jgi:hypothetical protein